MKKAKEKSDDTLDTSMEVLKTATCKTLSGKSTLTYQIGVTPDSVVHLRISKNTGGGFFSDEWVSFEDIYRTLEKRPDGSPVLSHFITPLLTGKSVNTSAFLLAALSHLRLVTQRYAHLTSKSLQAAADSASDIITGAMPKSN